MLEQNRNLQIELQQLNKGKKEIYHKQYKILMQLKSQKAKQRKLYKVFLWVLAGLFVAAIFVYALETNNNHNTLNKSVTQTDTTNNLSTAEQQQVNAQLQNAKDLWRDNNKEAALDIYEQLSQQNIPQAMFHICKLCIAGKK